MCSIKFLVRQPWIYAAVALFLFAVMCFTIIDVNRFKTERVTPSLATVSGEITALETIAAFKVAQGGASNETVQNYVYTFTLSHAGEHKILTTTTTQPIEMGMQVTAQFDIANENKVVKLIARGLDVVNHQDAASVKLVKAQKAKATMTHPVTILFIILLFALGVGGEVFRRKRPDLHAKYSMCAIDRINALDEASL